MGGVEFSFHKNKMSQLSKGGGGGAKPPTSHYSYIFGIYSFELRTFVVSISGQDFIIFFTGV